MSELTSPCGFGRWRIFRLALAGAALIGLLAGCASDEVAPSTQRIASDTLLALQTTPAVRLPPEPDWRDHFDDISAGGIVVNLDKRYLGYWEPYATSYHVFPIAVPLNADLTRTGDTKIVRKRENPDWRPTPDMRKRNPDLPAYIGPGPQNPLGERAMYLGWRYYAIHGTNNPASIGSQATSGCIRMMPKDVLWLFDRAMVGTPVRVLNDFDVKPRKPGEPRPIRPAGESPDPSTSEPGQLKPGQIVSEPIASAPGAALTAEGLAVSEDGSIAAPPQAASYSAAVE